MALYSPAPPDRPFKDAKPTLLVSWWITLFCTCLILLRLAGRYIRVESLFREDKITALALLPLYLRIACIHVVLLYGTNNVQLSGLDLSAEEINGRIIASKIVLAGRIFYTAASVCSKNCFSFLTLTSMLMCFCFFRLWTLKFTTLEFLNRLAGASTTKIYKDLITRETKGAVTYIVVFADK